MSTFKITISAGDSLGPTDNGQISIPNSSSNVFRINAQPVTHNASVVLASEPSATTYDVQISYESIPVAKIIGMDFVCSLNPVQSGTPGASPVCFLKLINGITGSKNLVIPLNPGQAWTYLPDNQVWPSGAGAPASGDIKGESVQLSGTTISAIEVTPDVAADLLISGTIELDD